MKPNQSGSRIARTAHDSKIALVAAVGMSVVSMVGALGTGGHGVYAASANQVRPGETICVQVGNPGDVLIANVTIVDPVAPGFATVGPTGADWRAYSTNNYGAGGAVPNLTATKIGSDGKVCITPDQGTHEIIDAVGFLAGSAFSPYQGKASPTRILDTRQASSPIGGRKANPGETICVQVGNPGDVLIANVTIVDPVAPGFATVGPTGADWRAYSTNNYGAGGAVPNLTATKIGSDGKVCITPDQGTHEIIDAVGFLAGSAFSPYQGKASPTRILDTRQASSPIGGRKANPGETICVQVGNPGDVLIANVTIVDPVAPGFATVGPTGADWRAYSTNNYGAGGAVPNLTATKIGSDGKVCITPDQGTHEIIDAVGFLAGSAFSPYQGKASPTRILDTRSRAVPDQVPPSTGQGLELVSQSGPVAVDLEDVSVSCFRYPFDIVIASKWARYEIFRVANLFPDLLDVPGNQGSSVAVATDREDPPPEGPVKIIYALQVDEHGVGRTDSRLPTLFGSRATAGRMLGTLTIRHYEPYKNNVPGYQPSITVLRVNKQCVDGPPPPRDSLP